MSLSERTIAALKPPERGQHLHADGVIPGFGVRVSQGGAKTFVLVVGTERRKVTIGRYPVVSLAQARDKARTILAERQLGLDKPLSPFFKKMEDEYRIVRDKTLGRGTLRKDPLFFKAFASLSRRRLGDIKPPEVQRILDAIEAPSSRVECFIRFKGLIRFAIKKGYIDTWPLERLEVSTPHFARDRVLDTEELRAILATARLWRSVGHPLGAIVELLILTGQRRQQIGSLARAHVDFDAGTISWPAELMKAKRSHAIPMGAWVREILEPHRVNALYFPNRYGEPHSFSSTTLNLFKKDAGYHNWVLHDLRRTLATKWQEMGIEIATTEKMLSHSAVTGGLVGIYQRSNYLAQMRVAVENWEKYLSSLLFEMEDANGRGDVRELCTA